MEADTEMLKDSVGSPMILPWALSPTAILFLYKLEGRYSDEIQRFGVEAYKAGREDEKAHGEGE